MSELSCNPERDENSHESLRRAGSEHHLTTCARLVYVINWHQGTGKAPQLLWYARRIWMKLGGRPIVGVVARGRRLPSGVGLSNGNEGRLLPHATSSSVLVK